MSAKTNQKGNVLHSQGHPDLTDARSPPAKKAFKAYSSNAKRRSDEKVPLERKRKRLSNSDIVLFVINKNIKTIDELMVEAHKRMNEGLKDIFDFIISLF